MRFSLRLALAVGIAVLSAVVGVVFGLPRDAAHGSTPLPHVFSIRHEPGADGHILTTVAFPVRIANGSIINCVVTEDTKETGYSGVAVALSQSCDFSVPIG